MQLPSAVHISLRIFLHFNADLRIFFPLPSSLAECFFFCRFVFYMFTRKFSIIIVAVAVRFTF